jgi:hypothetical protein
MLHRKWAVDFSLLAFRLLVYLYPIGFREQFGEAMIADFKDWLEDECREGPHYLARVWIVVLRELPSTAVHEHADVVRQWTLHESLRYLHWTVRLVALAAIPLSALRATQIFAIPWEEQVAIWLGLFGLAMGAIVARGHGLKCLVLATLSGATGFGIGLLCNLWSHPPVGDWLGGVAVLLAVVAVVALIGATYIRLMIEGLMVIRAVPALKTSGSVVAATNQ